MRNIWNITLLIICAVMIVKNIVSEQPKELYELKKALENRIVCSIC